MDSSYTANINASTETLTLLANFWPRVTREIQELTPNDFKNVELPLARIKKIMKLDDEVKMISAEAPIIFAKAAELFIQELTLRAWVHTEENKRRTLQRNDTALAISKYDQFDFLIDIVPREEIKPSKKEASNQATSTLVANLADTQNIQYYVTIPNGVTNGSNGLPLQIQGLQGLQGAQILQLAAPVQTQPQAQSSQPQIISLV